MGDETVGDETVEDETVEDETVGDETVEDETVEDETVPHPSSVFLLDGWEATKANHRQIPVLFLVRAQLQPRRKGAKNGRVFNPCSMCVIQQSSTS